ncbi:glycosyltransferase family 2 protein [Sagittula sp. SSi028]|uniref:glycosyltransferase family 2 protein n=1 Tax=Sagittula sp. SSi028 TaxID=3400636 RepID=UPI003AF9928A
MKTPPPKIAELLAQYEARRDAFTTAPGEGLPEANAPLAPLTVQNVADPDLDPTYSPPFRSNYHRKAHAIRQELAGKSELCSLHGLLIAHLRKRHVPEQAAYLFHRIWDEHADHLLEQLDARWLVSAITTFGDHGLNPTQRSTGLALSTLFGAMKLYETERLYSGYPSTEAYSVDTRQKADLPLDMNPYSLVGGGLDVNTFARLWQEAATDAVIAPLAHHLLTELWSDKRALFARLAQMRAEKAAKRAKIDDVDKEVESARAAPVNIATQPTAPNTLRWGLVTTTNAPVETIAKFAAHHLELGANSLTIYLDAPAPEVAQRLSHPRLRFITCDAVYWRGAGKDRPNAHQLRQAFNATRCLKESRDDLDWLGHIDIDEFLIPDKPVSEILFDMPQSAVFGRVSPAEALASNTSHPTRFKLTHRYAGVKKSELQDIYPTFGLHLYGGFLSHTAGKPFARTGTPNTRLGIHTLKYEGEVPTNRYPIHDMLLGHFHTPSWDHFCQHLEFRRTHGSYRNRGSKRPELGQAGLFDFLLAEEDDTALRAFFDEVCADTPELRQKLSQFNMLVEHDLELDRKVKSTFGALK